MWTRLLPILILALGIHTSEVAAQENPNPGNSPCCQHDALHRLQFAALLHGALNLLPERGFGASALGTRLDLRYERSGIFYGAGVSLWPHALRTPINDDNAGYHRPSWELMLEIGGRTRVTQSLQLGAYFGLTFGRRTDATESERRVFETLGFELYWQIGGAASRWALRYNLGLSTGAENLTSLSRFELSALMAAGLVYSIL